MTIRDRIPFERASTMIRLPAAVSAVFPIALPSPRSWAQTSSANDYFEGCQIAAGLGATGDAGALSVSQQLAVSACLGFVDGVNATMSAMLGKTEQDDAARYVCADPAPSNYEALAVWVGYLQAYPIQLVDDALTTYLRTMREA